MSNPQDKSAGNLDGIKLGHVNRLMQERGVSPAPQHQADPQAVRGSLLIDFSAKQGNHAWKTVFKEMLDLIARPYLYDKDNNIVMEADGRPAIDPEKQKKMDALKAEVEGWKQATQGRITEMAQRARELAKEFEPGRAPVSDVITADSLEGRGVLQQNQVKIEWQGIFSKGSQESLLITFGDTGNHIGQTAVLSWDRGEAKEANGSHAHHHSAFLKRMGLDQSITEANSEYASRLAKRHGVIGGMPGGPTGRSY